MAINLRGLICLGADCCTMQKLDRGIEAREQGIRNVSFSVQVEMQPDNQSIHQRTFVLSTDRVMFLLIREVVKGGQGRNHLLDLIQWDL